MRSKDEIRKEIERLDRYAAVAPSHEIPVLNIKRKALFEELGEKVFDHKNPFNANPLPEDFDFAKWREDFVKGVKK